MNASTFRPRTRKALLWAARSNRTSIRFRLGLAVAIALTPILALGLLQAVLGFNHDTRVRQALLIEASQRSAASARARMQAAAVLLDNVNPGTVGLECAPRLAGLLDRTQGYENFIRLNSAGRVQCAAASVRPGPPVQDAPWFKRLQDGQPLAVDRAPAGLSGNGPALLTAMRAVNRDGGFDGALVAIMSIASLRPDLSDPTLAAGAEIGLMNAAGQRLAATDPRAFADPPKGWVGQALSPDGMLYSGKDSWGRARVQAVSPLVGDDLFVVLSAPAPGVLSWARLNALSSIVLPILAWLAAWAAVWMVTDRVVIRWLSYLDRIAAIYARGRFSVRPVQADTAPREFRALAHTLDIMADGIVARDLSLRDSLSQKDAMMREIHHRVKNNLQVITSLLNMQQRALTDPAAREAMSDTRQRITALALIYRALYQSPDLRSVDVRQFLEELVAQLSSGEGGRPSAIRTELHADDLEIDPDKLAPLALFAVEAITNARKARLWREMEGTIEVRFVVSPEEVVFEVADDGKGIQAEASVAGRRPNPDERLRATIARNLGVQRHRNAGPACGLSSPPPSRRAARTKAPSSSPPREAEPLFSQTHRFGGNRSDTAAFLALPLRGDHPDAQSSHSSRRCCFVVRRGLQHHRWRRQGHRSRRACGDQHCRRREAALTRGLQA